VVAQKVPPRRNASNRFKKRGKEGGGGEEGEGERGREEEEILLFKKGKIVESDESAEASGAQPTNQQTNQPSQSDCRLGDQ
jgi:hypothetical protein